MPSIDFEITDQVAIIRLNRPEKLNAFNREMSLLLQEKMDECASNPDIRCVMLTGNGKGFSAGQDLAEVLDTSGPGMARILSEHYNPVILRIRNLRKPVVAVVNGVAAGAGANIALCCDITIAGASASFVQAFSKIGLIPDSGGTYFLPRLIGLQRATALMMLGDKIGAQQAFKMGMIYNCVDDNQLEEEGRLLCQKLAAMPTTALGFIKQALNHSAHATLEAQLSLEDQLQQQAAATADFQEGVTAFLEKRPALFKGD